VLFIIDGGKGVAKALKDRYGRKLLVQRCTIHKDRNLQAHLGFRGMGRNASQMDLAGTMNTLRWLRVVGDSIFALDAAGLGWFVLGLKTGWSLGSTSANPSTAFV
jgi:hypothetical protein